MLGCYFGASAGLPQDRTPGAISVPAGVNVFLGEVPSDAGGGGVDSGDWDARAAVAIPVDLVCMVCTAPTFAGGADCWLLLTRVGGSSTVVPPSTSMPVSYTGLPLAGS